MHYVGVSKIYSILRKGKWDIPSYLGDGSIFGKPFAYLIMGLPFGVLYALDGDILVKNFLMRRILVHKYLINKRKVNGHKFCCLKFTDQQIRNINKGVHPICGNDSQIFCCALFFYSAFFLLYPAVEEEKELNFYLLLK
jgi:hypothetical protein